MIHLGATTSRDCAGTSRREFLQVGAASAIGLSLADWFRASARGAADPQNDVSVILLFLWGGPPQMDLWDLKPKAPDTIRGPYMPISTATPGVQIGELLPQLAAAQQLYTLVRSATHRETEHPRAAHYMLTGNQVIRGQQWPNMGATVNKFAPELTQRPHSPLGSVVIGPRLVDMPITPTGQDGGFLGNIHAPFRIVDATLPIEKLAAMSPPEGATAERLARRQRLFRTVTQFQQAIDSDQTLALDAAYQRALAVVTDPKAKEAFRLDREPETVREKYGKHQFGQGVLLARRLVESGVRFVQVNWREHPINDYGFDNHGDNFKRLKDLQAPQLDGTLTALLTDLADRGMLQKTLVLVTGEFGRTPIINPAVGRDHWPFVFSYLIAGGGIAGGRVIGQSDQHAAWPADQPVSPENTVASIFSQLGLDLEQLRAAGILAETECVPGLV